jgi:hypothetical protein
LWNASSLLWTTTTILVDNNKSRRADEETENDQHLAVIVATKASSSNDDDTITTPPPPPPVLPLSVLLAQGTAMALRLATNDFPQTPTAYHHHDHDDNEETMKVVTAAEWTIDVRQLNDCNVAYSFGVGSDDPWTNLMAQYCRKVYAFDPTVSSYNNNYTNVIFHPWGLRSSTTEEKDGGGVQKNWSHPIYGSAVPEAVYLTFPQVQAKLSLLSTSSSSSSSGGAKDGAGGHGGTAVLTALKFDCEGCEYGAFADGDIPPTKLLFTEFHFAITLGMQTENDVVMIGAVSSYLEQYNCTVDRYRPNYGYMRDRTVLPYLVQHGGVPDGICCYEYAFTCHNV